MQDTYRAHSINNWGGSLWLLAVVHPGLLTHQSPQLVHIDSRAVGGVPLEMVVSHTHLTKVPRVAAHIKHKMRLI